MPLVQLWAQVQLCPAGTITQQRPPLLRLAAIEVVEGEEDLGDLAPVEIETPLATASSVTIASPTTEKYLLSFFRFFGLHRVRPLAASPSISTMRAAEIGASAIFTPSGSSAFSTADIKVAIAVPPSPAPLMPSGLSGLGVSICKISILGESVASGSK